MSHRKRGVSRAALDKAQKAAADPGPVRGPLDSKRGKGRMWNPAENPVQVHAPKPDDEGEKKTR